jgi:hypothetical protein
MVWGRRRRWHHRLTVIDGICPENQVRTGLPAGGRRIRTTCPSRVENLCFDWFCRLEGWKKPVQKSPPLNGGTGSSNPSPSSWESSCEPDFGEPITLSRFIGVGMRSSPRATAQQRPKANKANHQSGQGDDQGDPLRPWHGAASVAWSFTRHAEVAPRAEGCCIEHSARRARGVCTTTAIIASATRLAVINASRSSRVPCGLPDVAPLAVTLPIQRATEASSTDSPKSRSICIPEADRARPKRRSHGCRPFWRATNSSASAWKESGTAERRGGIVDYSDPLEPGGLATAIK